MLFTAIIVLVIAAVVVPAAVMIVIAFIAFLRTDEYELALRRRAAGQCEACGYDLRATPGQCPECGTRNRATARSE